MVTYPQNTIFVATHSKTASQNPITYTHQFLMAAFVLDVDSAKIIDVEINTICSITSDFIKQLLLGLSLTDDMDLLIKRVGERYFGDSAKALVVLLKDAQRRFLAAKQELERAADLGGDNIG